MKIIKMRDFLKLSNKQKARICQLIALGILKIEK